MVQSFLFAKNKNKSLKKMFSEIYFDCTYLASIGAEVVGHFPIKDMQPPPPLLSFDHSVFIDDTEPLTHYR